MSRLGRSSGRLLAATVVTLLFSACDDDGGDPSVDASVAPDRGPAALSTAASPTRDEAHYIAQAELYFDTLDTRADPDLVPDYSELVARWEWPPWLLLTGIGADQMVILTRAALAADPSTVTDRDCRAFATQPFARCYVVFRYPEGPCPIYEEFSFNDAGEMTFLEAWSVQPGLLPVADPEADPWGSGPDVQRLSTRLPGLGSPTGLIELESEAMQRAAEADEEVADFVRRGLNFGPSWIEAYQAAGPNLYAVGCGWPVEDAE